MRYNGEIEKFFPVSQEIMDDSICDILIYSIYIYNLRIYDMRFFHTIYIYIIIYNIYYIAYQENIHVDSCHVGLITRMPWLPWLQWLPGSMPIILKLPPGAGMGETAREIPKKV